MTNPLYFIVNFCIYGKQIKYFVFTYMQLVTPSVVATAVRTDITS